MTRETLLRTIRNHRGEILVELTAVDNIHWVKAIKSDLLRQLADVGDNQLTADYMDVQETVLYIGKFLG